MLHSTKCEMVVNHDAGDNIKMREIACILCRKSQISEMQPGINMGHSVKCDNYVGLFAGKT